MARLVKIIDGLTVVHYVLQVQRLRGAVSHGKITDSTYNILCMPEKASNRGGNVEQCRSQAKRRIFLGRLGVLTLFLANMASNCPERHRPRAGLKNRSVQEKEPVCLQVGVGGTEELPCGQFLLQEVRFLNIVFG